MSRTNQLLTSDLWAEAGKISAKSSRRLAAIAYVTARHVRFGEGDMLICDASEWQIRRGATSAAVLLEARKNGAAVYHCENLHAKVLLLDDCAIIGSANLSATSAEILEECGVLTRDRMLLGQARAFLEQLRGKSRLLEIRDLETLAKLPVDKRWENPRQSRGRRTKPFGTTRCWMVGLTDLDEDRLSAEEREVKKAGLQEVADLHPDLRDHLDCFRMVGRSKFRKEAQPGDRVIIVRAGSRDSKRLEIYRSVTLLARKTCAKSDLFYYDEAEASRSATVTRARMNKLLEKAASRLKPSPRMVAEVPAAIFEKIDAQWPG